MAVVREFALAKLPVPFGVLHVTPVLLDAVDPAVMFIAPELEQVLIAVPEFAVGADTIVNTFELVALVQGLFTAVSVIVTEPLVISVALGV